MEIIKEMQKNQKEKIIISTNEYNSITNAVWVTHALVARTYTQIHRYIDT